MTQSVVAAGNSGGDEFDMRPVARRSQQERRFEIEVAVILAHNHLAFRPRVDGEEIDVLGTAGISLASNLSGRFYTEGRHGRIADAHEHPEPGCGVSEHQAGQGIDVSRHTRREPDGVCVRKIGSLEQVRNAALSGQGNAPHSSIIFVLAGRQGSILFGTVDHSRVRRRASVSTSLRRFADRSKRMLPDVTSGGVGGDPPSSTR